MKAKLTVRIYQILRDRKITQTEAAPLARHHPGSGFGAGALPAGVRVRRQADGMSDHARPGRGGDRKAPPRVVGQATCPSVCSPADRAARSARCDMTWHVASVTSSSSSKTRVPREAPSGPLHRLPPVWRQFSTGRAPCWGMGDRAPPPGDFAASPNRSRHSLPDRVRGRHAPVWGPALLVVGGRCQVCAHPGGNGAVARPC